MKITFDNPYLLLLMIPIIAIAFIPYLRLKPKRRHTRNKVTSLILHCIIIVLACVVLTGIEGHNTEYVDSEIVFVTDYSDSTKEKHQEMKEYINKFIDDSRNSNSKVGMVNFGYGKVETVPLTKTKDLKNKIDSDISKIDKTGTDIENAIKEAINLFDDNEKLVKRIILLTDAMDTDGEISSLATELQGIRLDAIYFEPKDYNQTAEAQIEDLYVDASVVPFKPTNINISFKSHYITSVNLTITDNGKSIFNKESIEINLDGTSIEQKFKYEYTFNETGIHEIKAHIEATNKNDLLVENNTYYSYTYLESENSILILAPKEEDANDLKASVESYGYTPVVLTHDKAPKTLGELSRYKEVILMNANIPSFDANFPSLLKTYVEKMGGSVLTAGGENTYANGSMKNSPIETMLPINLSQKANNPRAIVICLDYSNSMGMYAVDGTSLYGKDDSQINSPNSKNGKDNRIKTAVESIIASINESLNPYDYLGLITFGSSTSADGYKSKDGYGGDTKIIFGLTPATQKEEMIEKINANVNKDNNRGGTCYDSALEYAEQMLINTDKKFNSKTVIFINDYDASNDHVTSYLDTVKRMDSKGISLTSIVIGNEHTSYVQNMSDVNPSKNKIYHTQNANEFKGIVKDLCKSLPTEVVNKLKNNAQFEFVSGSRISDGVNIEDLPSISTYNGGVSLKAKATSHIVFHNQEIVQDGAGNDVQLDNLDPIYAEWEYGSAGGKVGSLLIDLSGEWCSEFYTNVNTQKILKNIITGLIPKQDVDVLRITVDGFLLNQEEENLVILNANYTRRLEVEMIENESVEESGESVNQESKKEISLEIKIHKFDAVENKDLEEIDDFKLTSDSGNKFSRDFVTREPGLYRIEVIAKEDGEEVAKKSAYTTFSYSDEYDTFIESNEKSTVLDELCRSTFTESNGEKINGRLIPSSAGYENTADRLISRIDTTINIQLPLLIIALLLFVLDIFVRKFNFLWPHEMYKKYIKKEDLSK